MKTRNSWNGSAFSPFPTILLTSARSKCRANGSPSVLTKERTRGHGVCTEGVVDRGDSKEHTESRNPLLRQLRQCELPIWRALLHKVEACLRGYVPPHTSRHSPKRAARPIHHFGRCKPVCQRLCYLGSHQNLCAPATDPVGDRDDWWVFFRMTSKVGNPMLLREREDIRLPSLQQQLIRKATKKYVVPVAYPLYR